MTVPPQLCLTFQGNVKSNCTVNERTFPSQTSQDVSLHNNKRTTVPVLCVFTDPPTAFIEPGL